MSNPFDDDDGQFYILMNAEEQYSIWPEYLEIPAGWSRIGPHADRKTCMEWVDANWTDMRPASLRRQMEGDVERSS